MCERNLRPVIGISANYYETENEYALRKTYVQMIEEAGGIPVILPPGRNEEVGAAHLRLCSGLVLSGGGDLDPFYWGELPGPHNGEINPLRDTFEIELARQALTQDIPVLGICRGCQVLNVAAGGSLIQHLDSPGLSHQQKAPRNYPIHAILIERNSLLMGIVGQEQIRVNSFHHQAIRKPGTGLWVTACAPDGTVEAVESRQNRFALGVQWHPECLEDRYSALLFTALIKEAEQRPACS